MLKQANHCGPASFLVQLPADGKTKVTPAGQCGLCIGTIMISHTTKRTKSNTHNNSVRKKKTTPKSIPV